VVWNVPFDADRDEWLTATYEEKNCSFDFVSAGSGFLQVINLLSFLFLHSSRVALLDEPDSHMHDDLQRLTFDILNRLSEERNVQLIIASHSPTLIDAAGLEHVLLIDREFKKPLTPKNVDTLIPMLGDRGLALPPAKVMNTLKTRRALFVEGKEADLEQFILECGEIEVPGFKTITRGLTIFETGGATKNWPYDAVDCFQKLLGAELKYLFISDRDFLTDGEVTLRVNRAKQENRAICHLERRHRESYLVAPVVLARVLDAKFKAKHPDESIPDELKTESIVRYILEKARELEEDTRTQLLLEHEAQLKGDNAHRADGTKKLLGYFREAYTEPLSRARFHTNSWIVKRFLRTLEPS